MKKDSLVKVISLILCLLLMLPAPVFAQQSQVDYSGHWAERQIRSFLEKGFARLYKDGSFKPNDPITRADFAAMLNKAFGFTEKDDSNFKDVKTGDAFYNDMAIAKKAGYLVGLPDGTVKPEEYMSRQEYAVIIARLLKLDIKKDIAAAGKFKDAAQIPDWSRGAIGAVVKAGYMEGSPDNRFDPAGAITRAQAVTVLERCYLDNVKVTYGKPGTYSAKKVDGSVMINVPDVILEDTEIAGNLFIGEGVGNGNLKLKNVTVMGETIVRGGGPNSIVLEDCRFKNIIVIKEDNKIRIAAVGRTSVERVDMQSGGKLEEQNITGSGFGYVTIAEGIDPEEPIVLQGNFESVEVRANNAKIDIISGNIEKIEVAQSAANANISIASGAKVTKLIVAAKANITGKGAIGTADVRVQGVKITVPAATIKAAEGVNVITAPPATPSASTSGRGGSGGGNGGRSNDDNDNDNDRPKIEISPIAAQTIKIGEMKNITVNSNPSGAAVSVSSSAPSVATAFATGNTITVKGITEGTSQITVTCSKSGYSSATVSFTVDVEAGSLMSMSDDGDINEGMENGELITVTLSNRKFADTLTPSNWTLSGLPEGVTKGAVTRVSDTQATIALLGNSLVDYDSNITNIKLSCNAREVVGEQFSFVCSTGVILKAKDDPESISLAWAAAPGTNGAEATMNTDALTVKLEGGTFAKEKIDGVTLTGTAVTDAHITKESVAWVSPQELRLDLAWDGTDYDEDKVLTINIPVNAYADSKGGVPLTDSITCTATAEPSNQTSDMALVLTTPPAGGGNSISVGGGIKSGEVNVVNGTNSVVLTGTKKTAQTVVIGGPNAKDVTVGGTDTVPTFTVDTADISESGGSMAFTLTVSETGKIGITYDIKVVVAPKTSAVPLAQVVNVQLSAAGSATWDTVENAEGYSVLLFMDNAEIEYSKKDVASGVTSCDYSSLMKDNGAAVYTVKVKAVGDRVTYLDGPWSEASNEIIQLAPVSEEIAWVGDVAHWAKVANADSYDVYLYREGHEGYVTFKNIPEADVASGADFSGDMTEDGIYTFRVVAKGDGVTEADAAMSQASDSKVIGGATEWEKLEKDMAVLTIPLGENSSLEWITEKLGELPASLPNGTVVVWESSDETIISNDGQTISRPSWEEGDKLVTLIASLTNGSAKGIKTFALIVKRSGSDEQELLADMEVLTIPLNGNTALNKIRVSVGPLPALLPYGTTVEWKSSDTNVMSDSGSVDTFDRPASDTEVTMTATLTNGNETRTKDFILMVRKNRESVGAIDDLAIYADGTLQWMDLSSEIGYLVRLYKGEELQITKEIPDYSSGNIAYADISKEMQDAGPGEYQVTVQGLGNYVNNEDGPESFKSRTIRQLANVKELYWEGRTAHWTGVEYADSYDVILLLDGLRELTKTVPAEEASAGVDFTTAIEDGEAGTYTFMVVAKGDGRSEADSAESEQSSGYAKIPSTDDIRLELISPIGPGNTVEVGGSVRIGMINVVNGTDSIILKGTKKETQKIEVGGTNAGVVAVDEKNPLAPVFTINTDDISEGGKKAFTLTVSEAVYSDVIYRITAIVAAAQPTLSEDGIAQWERVPYAEGYNVQFYKGGEAYGDPIKVDDRDITQYDFSSIMDEISLNERAACSVTVMALGDGTLYQDGPVSPVSAPVYQLKQVKQGLIENDKVKWVSVGENSYKVMIYKDDLLVAAKTVGWLYAGLNNGVDFRTEMEEAGDGTYTLRIISVDDNASLAQRDSVISEILYYYNRKTTQDIGLTLNTPAPDENNTMTDLGKGNILFDVVNGTESVIIKGRLSSERQEIAVFGAGEKIKEPILLGENVTFNIDTSDISGGGVMNFTVRIDEEGFVHRMYYITLVVAASDIGSLAVSSEDDDQSDDKTVIKVTEAIAAENELVYQNFEKETAMLPNLDEIVDSGWTVLPEDGIIPAADGDSIVVVERREGTKKAKRAGQTTAVVEAEADLTAPLFVTDPDAQNIGATELTLFAQLNEAATVYYVVYANGETAPTAAELKAIGNTVDIPETNTEVNIEISGLQPGTDYDIYIIAEDKKGNLQAEVILIEVKTLD